MPNSKKQINSQLSSLNANPVFSDAVSQTAEEVQKTKFAADATLLGKSSGEVVGGLKSMESKLNGGGTTLGDAMTSFTADAPGLNGISDPTTKEISCSVPTFEVSYEDIVEFKADSDGNGNLDSDGLGELVGSDIVVGQTPNISSSGEDAATSVSSVISQLTGLGAPVAVLNMETLGGSSLKAIQSAANTGTEKVNELKSAIQSVASSVSSAGGSELSGITDSLKLDSIKKIAEKVSSVKSINPAAELLDKVNDATGIGELTKSAQNAFDEVTGTVDKLVNDVTSGIENVVAKIDKTAGDLNNFLTNTNIKTGFGLVQDIAESLSRQATSLIMNMVSGFNFNDEQLSTILKDAKSGDPKKFAGAVKQVTLNNKAITPEMTDVITSTTNYTDTKEFMNQVEIKATARGIDRQQIQNFRSRVQGVESQLNKIETTISGTTIKSAADFYVEEESTADIISRYKGASSAFSAFTYIDSKEELGFEIVNITRPVSEVVIHASETYTNQNIGAEEIHIQDNDRGFDGIQYHYIIRRDGRLQRGKPANSRGEASDILNHKQHCLDICLIGGINVPTGTENPLEYRSAQSFTMEQMNTLEAFLEAFYRRVPGGQVVGHNAIDGSAEDPYFDVVAYVDTLFRKKSVYVDLKTDTSVTIEELVNKRPV
jgi:N-acetylmuramoyl-L-alanine amidase